MNLEAIGPRLESLENCKDRFNILYYGAGWSTNIGNAFLDLGAMALLRMAAPKAEICFASEMPRWFFRNTKRQGMMDRFFQPPPRTGHALDIAAVTKCDLLVFVGMAMCKEFVEINGPTILEAAKNGAAVLLLGTGGSTYNETEKEVFGKFLRETKPLAFISRDQQSFEMFAECVPVSHSGIDCGFFLPDAYQPFPLNLPPYVVVNFDTLPEPRIDVGGRKLIRSHHDCWGPVAHHYTCHPDTLISDIPFDYLSLYSQAEEVHSDRVHACVAALSYGNMARFYSPTPRGSLFDAVGAGQIRGSVIAIDKSSLAARKAAQVATTRQIIGDFAGKVGKKHI